MSSKVFNPEGLPPPTGYSHVAAVTGGTLVFISGQVASDASRAIVGAGDFRAQVEQVFANLKRAAEGAGCKFQDIVKLNVFIVDSMGATGIPVHTRSPQPLCRQRDAARQHAAHCQRPRASGMADRNRSGGGDRMTIR